MITTASGRSASRRSSAAWHRASVSSPPLAPRWPGPGRARNPCAPMFVTAVKRVTEGRGVSISTRSTKCASTLTAQASNRASSVWSTNIWAARRRGHSRGGLPDPGRPVEVDEAAHEARLYGRRASGGVRLVRFVRIGYVVPRVSLHRRSDATTDERRPHGNSPERDPNKRHRSSNGTSASSACSLPASVRSSGPGGCSEPSTPRSRLGPPRSSRGSSARSSSCSSRSATPSWGRCSRCPAASSASRTWHSATSRASRAAGSPTWRWAPRPRSRSRRRCSTGRSMPTSRRST